MLLPEDLGQGGYREGFRACCRAEAKALHLGGAPLSAVAREWVSGAPPGGIANTQAPSAPPRYPQPHSCTIAVVSEAGLGSSCRTTGPEVSGRKAAAALGVERWPVRTFPTPSSAAPPLSAHPASGPRFAPGLDHMRRRPMTNQRLDPT